MKGVFLVVAGCLLLAATIQAFAFDGKEVQRLVATVDPNTCSCMLQNMCNIAIPKQVAPMIGIHCPTNLQFCCNARKRMLPFVTPEHISEVVAAAQRLNTQLSMVQFNKNRFPVVPAVPVSEPKPQPPVQRFIGKTTSTTASTTTTASSTTASTTATTTTTTTSEALITTEKILEESIVEEDECKCVERSVCPRNKQDFTFGKSCGVDRIRCCNWNQDEPETKLETTTTTTTLVTKKPTTLKTKPKFFVYSVPTVAPKKVWQESNPEPQEEKQPIQNLSQIQGLIQPTKPEGQKRTDEQKEEMIKTPQMLEQERKLAYWQHLQKQAKIAQVKEKWRRIFQPSLMEQIQDAFDMRKWFG